MGTLETVGIISNGEITTKTRDSYRNEVCNSIINGFTIGSTSVKENTIELGDFQTSETPAHKEKYPAWHGYYVDGLLQSIADSIDKIPDSGILMPIGIFDPTKPIALILSKLEDLFASLGINEEFLIANLGKILENAGALAEGFNNIIKGKADATNSFFDTLNKALSNNLDGIDDDKKDDILSAIEDVAKEMSIPPLPIPDIPIPVLDVSFMMPGIDIAPLFATKEAHGVDGIGTKFIKSMAAFISIPLDIMSKVGEFISDSTKLVDGTIKQIASAIGKLFTNIAEAVADLFSALVGFVWNIISNILSISQIAILEIASMLSIVIFFVKCFIVAIIGFLLGSGLIAKSAAQLLGLV